MMAKQSMGHTKSQSMACDTESTLGGVAMALYLLSPVAMAACIRTTVTMMVMPIPYTLSQLAPLIEDGQMPFYGEECASMLAVTYSSSFRRNIVSSVMLYTICLTDL